MGGDFAPKVTVQGAVDSLSSLADKDQIVLIGNRDEILSELSQLSVSPDLFSIVHASQVIDMEDKPIKAYQEKVDSSLSVAYRLLKNKEIDSLASAGNSGAVLAGAMLTVKPISGVLRPCAATVLPKEDGGQNVLLDVGTNPDAKPDVLCQFALIGSIYSEYILGVKNPRVALLNIGTEEGKGNIQCQVTYKLMQDYNNFNFIGNREPRDIFKDKADVFVVDGFVGNILIKQIETFYRLFEKRGGSDPFFEKLNYEYYGGSPILGLNAPVVLGHGISSALAIKNMLLLCKKMDDSKITEKLTNVFLKFADNF